MWCFKSEGLQKVNHLEVVVMLEVRRKEDIFPVEVLRVYKGILFLASKFGMLFVTAPSLVSVENDALYLAAKV